MQRLPWPPGLAALFLSPLLALAQPATSDLPRLTLDQAQELAASRSPELSAAQRELDAASGAVHQASARRNPELNAIVEDLRAATRTTTTTIDVPLELGAKRQARTTAAERGRALAAARLVEARAGLRAEVLSTFFSVAVAQDRVKLADDSARLADQAADVADRRVAAGKASPVDATRSKVDAANARLEVAQAQAQWRSSRQRLSALWGDAEPRFGEVAADLADVPVRPGLPDLLREVDDSATLVSSRMEVDRRKALVDVERSKAAPDVVVSVGARRDNELGRTQAVIGISVPLPIFDRNQGATYEASRRLEQAEDAYAAARVRLLADVSQAATQLSTAQASVQVLRDVVLPAARRAYDASLAGFEAGKFGFIDVIDAQRSLLQARTRYLDTLAAAWQAASTLDRLLGR